MWRCQFLLRRLCQVVNCELCYRSFVQGIQRQALWSNGRRYQSWRMRVFMCCGVETERQVLSEWSPSLIVGAGTTVERNTYTWQDTTAEANVPYYYRLEEVSLSGNRRALATVRLRGFMSSANKLLWKWADLKKQ